MKRVAIILILLVAPILSIGARDYDVRGIAGGVLDVAPDSPHPRTLLIGIPEAVPVVCNVDLVQS